MKNKNEAPQDKFAFVGNIYRERNTATPSRILRLKDVLRRIPVGNSTWWDGIKRGIFPRGIKISRRVTVWRESEIEAICQGRDWRQVFAEQDLE